MRPSVGGVSTVYVSGSPLASKQYERHLGRERADLNGSGGGAKPKPQLGRMLRAKATTAPALGTAA